MTPDPTPRVDPCLPPAAALPCKGDVNGHMNRGRYPTFRDPGARASAGAGGLVQWILDGRKASNAPVKSKPAAYRLGGSGRANEAVLADVLAAGAPLRQGMQP